VAQTILSVLPKPRRFDPITADFTYIRWLGNRKGIEERTKTWDKTIVDRTSELQEWVKYGYLVQKRVVCVPDDSAGRGITIYAYAHDPTRIAIPSDQRESRGHHYAGHAPAAVEQFLEMWEKVEPPSKRPTTTGKQTLFG
jgi:hypothetical protein